MEEVMFWEISDSLEFQQVSAHETSVENEISDVRNKFYQLAKACGMESEFSSDIDLEAAISCLATPTKSAPYVDTLMVSPEENERSRRKRLSYADRILAELIAECSTDTSDIIESINENEKENVIVCDENLDSRMYPSAKQYTSYRRAVEFNPLYSYASNDNLPARDDSFSSASSTSLSNVDCSSDDSNVGNSDECLSDNQRVPSPEGYDLMTELMSRTQYCAEYIEKHTPVKTDSNESVLDDTAPVFERLQPEGAEDEPVRQISLGSSRSTSSSSQSVFEGVSATSYSRRMRESTNSKTSRSSRSSRSSASSRPLASSTMMEEMGSMSHYDNCRGELYITDAIHQSYVKGHQTGTRRRSRCPPTIDENSINIMSEQCSVKFLEPLSVIEPVNRDSYIRTVGKLTDEKPGSLPRTSTQIWCSSQTNGKSNKENVNSLELSPPNFHSVPVSPQSSRRRLSRNQASRQVIGSEKLQLSTQTEHVRDFSVSDTMFLDSESSSRHSGVLAPCNSFLSNQTDCDTELSSIVPDVSQTGSLFKMPTNAPMKRLSSAANAQNIVKRVVRRTSTPLPSISPSTQKTGCKRTSSDSQSGFDRKSLARKLKRFKNSFSKEKILSGK